MNQVRKAIASSDNGRTFPPDAYEYHDDVTNEAIERVRVKAAPYVDEADLELIDGLGKHAI